MMPENKDNNKLNDSSELSPLHLWRGVGGEVNCDMGEGIGNDEAIMPFITSASIACGYHAGDADTMKLTVELAMKFNVAIGAHPSYLDRENFGRTDIRIPLSEVYDLVTKQIHLLREITISAGTSLHHVKPHGALYNMAARSKPLAAVVALAVKDVDEKLKLYGLSGSHLIKEGRKLGVKTVSEVFADRSYQDDGRLTPRSDPDALINDTDKAVQQVLQMIKEGTVTTVSGKIIPIVAETICIHGDGMHAVEFAKAIHDVIKK
jgi:5-oxoprolinase (ATP-hydrolysing) subunit A